MDNQTNAGQNNTGQGNQTPPAQPQNQLETPKSTRNLFAVLAYFGPLVIISLLAGGKDDSFVKFHIKQGLVLFSIEIIVWIISRMFWPIWFILSLINLVTFILSIIGIINALGNKEKELPIVGSWSKYFPI